MEVESGYTEDLRWSEEVEAFVMSDEFCNAITRLGLEEKLNKTSSCIDDDVDVTAETLHQIANTLIPAEHRRRLMNTIAMPALLRLLLVFDEKSKARKWKCIIHPSASKMRYKRAIYHSIRL